MDHNEALQEMATERYLLDELSPVMRDAFEEHFFDCPECAMDLRAAAAFIEEAKVHLPELTGPLSVSAGQRSTGNRPASKAEKKSWFAWWGPAFAAPVFGVLLLVMGYQNLVTMPALRAAASEPVLAPTVYLHAGTRSGGAMRLDLDRKQGIALIVDRPQQPGYASFLLRLIDARGQAALSVTAPGEGPSEDGTLSLAIPGKELADGTYTLAISGVAADGQQTEIERHVLDVHLRN